jgi:acetylglutamate kinase
VKVVKIGGRAQHDERVIAALARAWVATPRAVCVVHGGGSEISKLQLVFGREPAFVGGRRITAAEDLDLVRMSLSGAANKRLVSALLDAGVPAWGISGEDAGMLVARRSGDENSVTGVPTEVKTRVLNAILTAGYLPVVSPVARGEYGGALNVNGDDAAAALAAGLSATELVFVSDVPGVLDESGVPLAQLDVVRARELTTTGSADGGMAAKLEAAFAALDSGVRRVRIGSSEALTDDAAGTLLVRHAEALV